MIICSNCGSTNSEAEGYICRKCGALLPISSKSSRVRISIGSKENNDDKTISLNSAHNSETEQSLSLNKETQSHNKQPNKSIFNQVKFSAPEQQSNQILNQLSEIPKPSVKPIPQTQQPKPTRKSVAEKYDQINSNILQEIAPQPFNGSIISNRGVYSASKQETLQKIPKNLSEIPLSQEKNATQTPSSLVRRKILEDDMTSVVSSLSKKLEIPKEEKTKEQPDQKPIPEKKLPPNSMSDILNQVLSVEKRIEASAIIKTDGTILASAISNRISDSLFATIGQNVSMIGNDIIESLQSGVLNSISIRGTEGVLDLAPIDKKQKMIKDMYLIIFSHPNVKSGIINIATSLVKKQIKEYLGIKD